MGVVVSRAEAPVRRKSPTERRAEIVEVASRIAVGDGLDKVTAKRVATELGVVPGLVNHYFPAVDDLVAASFGYAAREEREEIFRLALQGESPRDRMRRLLAELLDPRRDPVSLLWLDAWQASRKRPALLVEVVAQMEEYTTLLTRLVQDGVDASVFAVADSSATALHIMSLIDGLSVQAASRSEIDYRAVSDFVVRTTEAELGLTLGALAPIRG
jgi:AcrR family transcriptional regulator